jgi:hypothetical protein
MYLLNSPNNMIINFINGNSIRNTLDLFKMFLLIPQKFKNFELYELADKKNLSSYELYGMICQIKAHYVSFFKSRDSNDWIFYDDVNVNRCTGWKDLLNTCIKNSLSPNILLYRKCNSNTNIKDILDLNDINKLFSYSSTIDRQNESNDHIIRITNGDKRKTEQDYLSILPISINTNEKEKKIYRELAVSFNKIGNLNNNVKMTTEESKIEILDKVKLLEQKNPYTQGKMNPSIKTTIKEENKVNSRKSKIFLSENKSKSETIISVNKSSDYQNRQKIDTTLQIGKDEWTCETSSCKNINKNSVYRCESK